MGDIEAKLKRITFFIGIDVGKSKLDYAVMHQAKLLFHQQGANEPDDISSFVAGLKAIQKFSLGKAVFCMEHNGIYCNRLLVTLKKLKANVVLENPLIIKRFLGAARGKDDKADAIKIASYAQKQKNELKLWNWRRPIMIELSNLVALRNRLLNTAVALKMPIREQEAFINKKTHQQQVQLCSRTFSALAEDLSNVEKAIDFLIQSDVSLKRLMAIIVSVPNVGRITALKMITSTNEFRDIADPKKFACYAGVAPFKSESGLMKRKAKVSNFANKKMKSLLHLCAISAAKHDQELKAYYIKKTSVEGKPKLAVINAIRYKIITRVFACVRQNRVYEKNYNWTNGTTAGELIICEA
jgi:transposase